MEKIEKILNFIKYSGSGNGDGNGSGYGYHDGAGHGAGYGDGSGDVGGNGSGYSYYDDAGNGYGYGNGYGHYDGYGNGAGNVYGNGYGNGYGSGYGYSSGYGNGYGNGSKIKKYQNYIVFYVDNVPTIFDKIKGDVAHCQIIDDASYNAKKCYLIKGRGYFAHGDTLAEARQALREKILSNLDIEQRIEQFTNQFNANDTYFATEFFEWHHILTGSCLTGRKLFVESHNIDMSKKYTVQEFIKICENDYGGDTIKKLKEFYK